MTTAQVVETSVTVNNNSPIQDYIHPDDQTQPTFEITPGFKPFTKYTLLQEPLQKNSFIHITTFIFWVLKSSNLPPSWHTIGLSLLSETSKKQKKPDVD